MNTRQTTSTNTTDSGKQATSGNSRRSDGHTGNEHIDVSVVLAVYNEAEHLARELDRITQALETSTYTWEVIVVDDGSTDGSSKTLENYTRDFYAGIHTSSHSKGPSKAVENHTRDDSNVALANHTRIRLLKSARNRGCGTARRVGTLAARGRVVVWTDADMTYPNDRIPTLVETLDGVDQVVGARASETGTFKALRVPAKWAIRKLASYLTRTRIPDLNSGFRAMRRDVAIQFADQLPVGFSCVTTITMMFLSNGYSVSYLPITYERRSGRSKFRWWSDTRRYILQVVRMVLSHEPLRFFMPITTILGVVFAVKLGYDLTSKDFRVATNTLLLGFACVQILAVGLIADLVVRTSKTRNLIPPADIIETHTALVCDTTHEPPHKQNPQTSSKPTQPS
ncbi:MAG: glycosyltransferase family 2 protein [Acidimicrobiaceae bacterium]|nr:glycosyltransferase family 2 protein [Acidimicrobiaceae bacterium]